ncbi:folylpolyglutamate synthase/dihydrofolate synthase family protein [Victivallis sp. Marseille-Q1083]|uniref:bifunctional folylpolyglutamate synthase/dihydrofolate synthase n=1 Tax=Victivallis sp. Marseille-Q1083 TaxID=2717288 RepID=UPI0015888A65|nr:folylpolyglutamate synthase/dihydrofolate synthase family protein [Victivallis sp. Marseille-Q1083]
MSFDAAVAYLGELQKFGIKLGLEQIGALLTRCGNPQRALRFLHLAGSNGKGSCGAMLHSMLHAAGFRTGFYSSPHLVSVTERIRIDGRAVSEAYFAELAGRLQPAAEAMRREGRAVTYFEFTTAMAMLAFAEAGVDFVIWETGMGGRFDATNIVDPVVSIITNIAFDHQKYLGDTLAKIAFEKAGIIKPGRPVFVGELPEEALAVIRGRSEECGAVLTAPAGRVGRLRIGRNAGGRLTQQFEYDRHAIELSLIGPMQRRNFRTVYEVMKYLARTFGFPLERALAGLKRTNWPARCQEITPALLVDGGHNPDGLAALRQTLEEVFPGEKLVFIFGAFADKDVPAELQIIAPLAAEMIFVPIQCGFRPSRDPQELAAFVRSFGDCRVRTAANLAAALQMSENSGRRVVAGSLYLAGELLAALVKQSEVLDL